MNKISIFVAALIAVSFAFASDDVDEAWKLFKVKHNKNYRSTDEAARKRLFSQTHDMIKEHNSNNPEYQLEHNEFSDMTKREKSRFLGIDSELVKKGPRRGYYTYVSGQEDRQVVSSIDYRKHPCLSAVRNQGQCGSCWAFSAIAALEFSKCKKNNNNITVSLSEQQLVDCDPYDGGCDGGWYYDAWEYLKGGSAKRASYPAYTAVGGTCKYTSSMLGAKVSSYGEVSGADMQAALQNYGPLAIALNVTDDFYQYKSGVYSSSYCIDGDEVNHAVVVVGYGTQNGIPYWIVRNSWGTTWGASGYILVKRGVNMCNIESYAYYVQAA